jgi:hypothetical protein
MHNYPNCLNNSVDRWAVVAYGAINLKLKALIEKSTSFRPEQIERVSRCLIPSFNCVVNLSFSKLKKPTASETFCIRYSEGCIQLSLPLSLSLSLSHFRENGELVEGRLSHRRRHLQRGHSSFQFRRLL